MAQWPQGGGAGSFEPEGSGNFVVVVKEYCILKSKIHSLEITRSESKEEIY